jgi:hypothetical protein
MNVENQSSFKDCGGKLLANLIGGSRLYSLNTPDSDYDERGVFYATDPYYLAGLSKIESIVLTGETDATYYEIVHFFNLLRKSNTQVLEILFAPDKAFTWLPDDFKEIRENGNELFCSETLKKSLQGYFHSEMRLATGERTGLLGSKRKANIETYGFSQKNFCQMIRICLLGINLFKHDKIIVDSREYGDVEYNLLMEIKTQPQNFTKDQLVEIANGYFQKLLATMDSSSVKHEFNKNLAAELILQIKYNDA